MTWMQGQASANLSITELHYELREHKRQFAQQAAKIEYVEREMIAMRRMVEEIYNRLIDRVSYESPPSYAGNTVSDFDHMTLPTARHADVPAY